MLDLDEGGDEFDFEILANNPAISEENHQCLLEFTDPSATIRLNSCRNW